jgi:hypothetical protein
MIRAVEQNHISWCTAQRLGGGQTAESTAYDYNAW